MKSYVVVACIKTALWSATLTFAMTMPLSLLLHHATNCQVKRCINITEGWWRSCTFKEQLLQAIKAGDIWLIKVKYDNEGNRIEVTFVWRLVALTRNMFAARQFGACKFDEIPGAFVQGMSELCTSMLELALAMRIHHQKQTDKSDSECLDWQISYGGTE